jgi:hypothetical protein
VAVGGALASVLGKIDESLEAAGVLPKLDPPAELSDDQIREFGVVRQAVTGCPSSASPCMAFMTIDVLNH